MLIYISHLSLIETAKSTFTFSNQMHCNHAQLCLSAFKLFFTEENNGMLQCCTLRSRG